MPIFKECQVDTEGTICGKVVPSQGLHGHLVSHGLEADELAKAMKDAIEVPDPNIKKVSTTPEGEGKTEALGKEEGERAKPILPEEQMLGEMAAQLERRLQMLLRGSPKSISYVIERFKEETSLQEDPYQLHTLVHLANPLTPIELIQNLITHVFAIRNKYNLSQIKMLRTMPTYQHNQNFNFQQDPYGTQTTSNWYPWYDQQQDSSTFPLPYPNQQPPPFPPPPPPRESDSEVKKLLEVVKDLKTEISQNKEASKFDKLLEQQKKDSEKVMAELKKDRDTLEQRHKEEIRELKIAIQSGKERDKFTEVEGQVNLINSKLDQSIGSIKDMFTEHAFKDKEKGHELEIRELRKEVADAGKNKTTDLDIFDKMEKWEDKITAVAKKRGYGSEKGTDMKEKLVTAVTDVAEKGSKFLFDDKAGDTHSPPPAREFRPMGPSQKRKLEVEAARTAQLELEEREREIEKIEAENNRLREMELKSEVKLTPEKTPDPPTKDPPKENEPAIELEAIQKKKTPKKKNKHKKSKSQGGT